MSATRRRFSPEALFAISGICQYSGAVIAVRLFDEVRPATVAMFRVALAAIPILLISWRSQRRWTRADVLAAAVFGIATALMNLFFYLAIDRLPLGKSVVIEFIGPIAVAAWFTRTRRNTGALLLAVTGVLILSGVEVGGDPLGIFFIFCASMMWATYIVLGRRVAALERGLSGLGVGLVIGGVFLLPFGAKGSMAVLTDTNLLLRCFAVAVLSSAIGYGIDQVVLRRIPVRRFAVLMALLPVTAMAVGFMALHQRPSAFDLLGAALVITGVLVQDRDELPTLPDELPA
ncbi:MAG: EamA family transporter [Actinomycetota bacterium]